MADSTITTPTTASNINTVSSDTLTPQPKLAIPTAKPDQTPYESIIQGAITSLPSVTTQVDSANKTNESLLASIVGNDATIANKEVYSQNQQNLQGVQDKQKELDALNAQFTDLGAQIKGLTRSNQAAPLVTQENNLGRGTSIEGTDYQTVDSQRLNAIKALTLASQGDILGAQVTNAESRLQRAKDNAQLAVDLKYKPLEAQNAMLKDMLDLNSKYILDPAEKKKTEATAIALAERTRLLAQKKEDEKTNNDLIINAQSQLAPSDVIERAKTVMANGGSTKDVIMSLGKYAGSYQQALALQEQIKTSKLNQDLIRANTAQTLLENQKKSLENLALSPSTTAVSKQNVIAGLGDTIKLIDGVKTSSGLSGFVGPTGLQRLSPITSFTGEGQNFLAGVQQLTSQKTMDALINLKAAGGTLGALSDGERTMLQGAATKLNSWAVTDNGKPDGKVIGYKIDEDNFKAELTKIRDLTNRAIVANGGQEIPDPSVPNQFQMAMGITNTTPIGGVAIINKTNSDGSFDFKLPASVPLTTKKK